MTVAIYRLTSGWSIYHWLCAADLAARKASGWSADKLGEVEGDCDDCEKRRQRAPGYLTPTIAPVLTDASRRHVPAPPTQKKKRAPAPTHLHSFDDGEEAQP